MLTVAVSDIVGADQPRDSMTDASTLDEAVEEPAETVSAVEEPAAYLVDVGSVVRLVANLAEAWGRCDHGQ